MPKTTRLAPIYILSVFVNLIFAQPTTPKSVDPAGFFLRNQFVYKNISGTTQLKGFASPSCYELYDPDWNYGRSFVDPTSADERAYCRNTCSTPKSWWCV